MQKTVNSNHGLVLFNPLIGPLSGATTPGQSGPGTDGNEGVLYIPQSSSITGTSPSDLASYPGHSLGEGSYPSAEKKSVYSTAPANWATDILDSQNISRVRNSTIVFHILKTITKWIFMNLSSVRARKNDLINERIGRRIWNPKYFYK